MAPAKRACREASAPAGCRAAAAASSRLEVQPQSAAPVSPGPCTRRVKQPQRPPSSLRSAGSQGQVEPAASALLAQKDPVLRRILSRLHKMLSALPAQERLCALSRLLSQSQRLALETFILAQKAAAGAVPRTRQGSQCPRAGHSQAAAAAKSRALSGTVMEEALLPKRRVAARGRRAAAKTPSKQAGRREVGGLVVNPQSNGCYYFVQIAIGSLRFISRADRNLATVQRYCAAMLELRKRVCGAEEPEEVEDFRSCSAPNREHHLRQAVHEVLLQHCLTASEVGLRFFISIKPLWASQRLETRLYNVADPVSFNEGLSAWHRLEEARPSLPRSWIVRSCPPSDIDKALSRLREVFLEVMVSSGAAEEAVQERLQELEKEQQARKELQLQAWESCQMAREERAQRTLQRLQRRKVSRCAPAEMPEKASRAAKPAVKPEQLIGTLLAQWAAREEYLAARQGQRRATRRSGPGSKRKASDSLAPPSQVKRAALLPLRRDTALAPLAV